MAWIESHQALDTSPKLKRAARQLGVSRPTVSGHLHFLWHWALDNAFDGDLSDLDDEDIADAAEWEGEPSAFVQALTDCGPGDQAGFLERDGLTADGRRAPLVIHDWWEHTKHLREKREAALQANHQRWHVQRGVVEPSCGLCCPAGDPKDNGHPPDDLPPDSGGSPSGVGGDFPSESTDRNLPEPTPPARAHAKPASYPQEPPADAGGGEKPPDPKQRAERALQRIRGGMPHQLAGRLDQQHQQALDALTPLALAGWQPRELADAISQRSWDGVHDPARTLKRRAADLDGTEPPSLRARRAREPPAGCPNEQQHGQLVDDDGQPEPCPCGWTPDPQQEAS